MTPRTLSPLPENSPKRRTLLSILWDGLARNRTLLSLLIFLYSFIDPDIKSRERLWFLIAVYAAANLVVRLLFSSVLFLKRVRVIPSLIDVIFISLVIHNSTGPGNSWFLFYLFPIIEVSRYMGSWGTRVLAALSIVSYIFVYLASASSERIDLRFFVMRCLVLVGVAEVSSRARQKELLRLTDVHEEIDFAILKQIDSGPFDELKLERVLNLILRKGLKFTNSEMGYIKLLNSKTGRYEIATGHPQNYDWNSTLLDEEHTKQAVASKRSLRVPQIQTRSFPHFLGTYFRFGGRQPQSALFVPLRRQDSVVGIIAVYSNWSRHYTKMEARRLAAFTPLVEMAIKTVESAETLSKVKEAELYYRELIENAPDPIIVLDKHGKIVVFNQACQDLWGFTFEEVKDQPVANYYATPEHAKEIGRLLWQSEGNRLENFRARIKIKSGEIIPISLSACFVKKNSVKDRSIGVFKDRREAIRMEEKMLQAERLAVVGGLAGTAGHDIKHNIAIALNYVNGLLFKCDPEQEPQLHEIYTTINAALRESVDEFKNLLTAHKPRTPQKLLLMISELLGANEERMRRQALDKNTQFVVNYPDTDFKVAVDLEQMLGVFTNLFTNSLDAILKRKWPGSPSGAGLITLTARVKQNYAQIVWKDNGCGISKDQRQNIFNAFVTSKGDKGTGLGLYIVQTIIQNHDGRIEVESKPGEGATFFITLPIPTTKAKE